MLLVVEKFMLLGWWGSFVDVVCVGWVVGVWLF